MQEQTSGHAAFAALIHERSDMHTVSQFAVGRISIWSFHFDCASRVFRVLATSSSDIREERRLALDAFCSSR